MNTVHLYFRQPPLGHKIFPGDRHLVNFLRKIAGKKKVGGVERVFLNLCKSFDRLKIEYTVNKPFSEITPAEPVVVLGAEKYSLQGYGQPNPVIAGIGLMSHPCEWLTLFKDYPVAKYLQHSQWAKDIYTPYFGDGNCDLWAAGIDTDEWLPSPKEKTIDILVYNKIRWKRDQINATLKDPILKLLDKAGLSYKEIVYGHYFEAEYRSLLQQSSAMLFLCEHESQGFACCEAMSMNVPVLAWDQGFCLDPNQFRRSEKDIPATSVPFFDESCGIRFKDFPDFEKKLNLFWGKVQSANFEPRRYILQNISLEKSGERMMEIIKSVYK